jgi:ATP-dependent helicase IRC3
MSTSTSEAPRRAPGRESEANSSGSVARPTLQLRPYQRDALTAIETAEARGVLRQLLALPTGCGKTLVFAELIRRRGGRALVLAHRDELVTQAVDKLAMTGVTRVGIVKAERNDLAASVIVASVQTASRPNRLAGLPTDFTTVVVEEAHHAPAESYCRILAHVGAFRPDGPLVLGVTATAERADGQALGAVFQEIVYEARLLDMVRAGYLAELRALQVHVAADFNALHTRAGDFIDAEAEAMLLAGDAPDLVARAYQQHAADRKALVFTPTVRVAHAMAKALLEAGVAAEAVDGETPLELRRELLRRFHRGDTRVVANCGVLAEGYDEPSVDCIIVARPTRSRPLYTQMLGRGTRRHPGKDDCLILDVVGLTTRHDLQTAATLFGVEPTGAIEASVLDAVDRAAAMRQAREARGELVARAIDLFRARPLHWVAAGADRFALALGEHGTLVLDVLADERWAVRQLTRHHRTVTLQDGLDLGYAQGWAEDHARRLGAKTLIDPSAAWRQAPTTDRQVETLHRCRVPVPSGLTKGAAADLLTASFARARR